MAQARRPCTCGTAGGARVSPAVAANRPGCVLAARGPRTTAQRGDVLVLLVSEHVSPRHVLAAAEAWRPHPPFDAPWPVRSPSIRIPCLAGSRTAPSGSEGSGISSTSPWRIIWPNRAVFIDRSFLSRFGASASDISAPEWPGLWAVPRGTAGQAPSHSATLKSVAVQHDSQLSACCGVSRRLRAINAHVASISTRSRSHGPPSERSPNSTPHRTEKMQNRPSQVPPF